MQILSCGACGANNAVSVCSRCGRAFVVTRQRVVVGTRQAEDAPLADASANGVQPCDYCLSKDMSEAVSVRVERGVRQRTCPVCKKEFLTAHGLLK